MKKPYVANYTITYRNTALVYAEDEESARDLALDIWSYGTFDPELDADFEGDAEVSPATPRECRDHQYDAFMDEDHLTDAEVEELWMSLDDVPMNPETERMEQPFLIFPAATPREKIWHWFDKHHSKGIAYLLYGEEPDPAPAPAPAPAPKPFTVERTVGGQRITVELTPEELTSAYYAQKDIFDEQDVSGYLDELNDEECIELCGKPKAEIIPLIPQIAKLSRKQQDDCGWEYVDAVEYAIHWIADERI